ncbi:MAG: MoxR family ATPase [Proteobacteria bacterium]|nr:MoxR family ATPase [Pseudomonadota bacterium]
MDNLAPDTTSEIFRQIKLELHREIVGQDRLLERLLVALLADGHILLEGVPGLAKTKTLTALTQVLDAKMSRIQFTPDILPSDVIGTEVYRPQSGDFVIRKGPVFTNLLLADEINRAPAKVQSALLQAMQEREVTIGEETFKLPEPFMVLATQNPLEQEGTYALPEAQVDRFLMKVKVGYPSFEEEVSIIDLASGARSNSQKLNKLLPISQLEQLRRQSHELYIDPKIDRYIVSLVHATRNGDAYGLKGLIEWGASPRASIALKTCARALAFIKGKNFVTPDDVKDIAPDVLRHRILVTFEAEARGVDSDEIIRTLLSGVTIP